MTDTDKQDRPKSRQLSALRPLAAYLWPYKWQVIGATLALVLTAMVTLSVGQGLRYLVDQGFGDDATSAVLQQALGLFLLLVVLLAAGSFVRFYLVSWIGERISADLRSRVFRHVIRFDPAFFEGHLSSDIQARITTDTSILQTVIGSSASIAARNFIMLIGAIILLVITNVKLAAIVLISVPLVVAPLLLIGRRVRRLSKASQQELASTGSYVSEVLRHIKVVQANLHEPEDVRRFERHVAQTFAVSERRIRVRAVLMTMVMLITMLAIGAMLWVGGQDVITARTTSGQLVAFIFYALLTVGAVAAISEVYADLQRAAGAAERLFELLAIEPQLKRHEPHLRLPATSHEVLQFESVNHRYPSRPETEVLRDVSLTIHEGDYVALVGPSGAGKSTIFELILRFYDPSQGCIRFAGMDVRHLASECLRGAIAVVPQDPVLFRGSVLDNIRYGRLDATDDEITTAASAANVLEFTEQRPEGMAIEVGEGGCLLSGGQRQRIVIARAFLKRPRLLLLDEATSSLDAENGALVQGALAKLIEHTTTLVITHQLSRIQGADTIMLMNQGRLVAEGPHEQLLKDSALYARLVELQFDYRQPKEVATYSPPSAFAVTK